MNNIEVVVLLLPLLVFDGCQAELDCLLVGAAFLLDCLLEVVKRAFLYSCLGFGLCIGGFVCSRELLDCFFELSEIAHCLLV